MRQNGFWINSKQLHDIDEQAGMLPQWEQEYQQLGHGKFAGSLSVAQVQEFTLIRETSNKSLHESVMPPPDQIVVGMCLNSENAPTVNGKVFDRDSLIVIDGRYNYDIRSDGHMELLGIAVNRDYFFSKVQEDDASIASDAIASILTPLEPRAANMLRQYFINLSDILQNRQQYEGNPLTPRMLASSTLSNIALAVSLSQPQHYLSSAPKLHQRRAAIVQNAIDYMRKNACEEIGILDVCAATHVSRRTLQYCFEERLNISPLQYLKALRLNQARRQLKHLIELQLAHERENTIASVAALCGFHHASRFASDYKRMFGELPSQIKAYAAADPA